MGDFIHKQPKKLKTKGNKCNVMHKRPKPMEQENACHMGEHGFKIHIQHLKNSAKDSFNTKDKETS